MMPLDFRCNFTFVGYEGHLNSIQDRWVDASVHKAAPSCHESRSTRWPLLRLCRQRHSADGVITKVKPKCGLQLEQADVVLQGDDGVLLVHDVLDHAHGLQ